MRPLLGLNYFLYTNHCRKTVGHLWLMLLFKSCMICRGILAYYERKCPISVLSCPVLWSERCVLACKLEQIEQKAGQATVMNVGLLQMQWVKKTLSALDMKLAQCQSETCLRMARFRTARNTCYFHECGVNYEDTQLLHKTVQKSPFTLNLSVEGKTNVLLCNMPPCNILNSTITLL